MKETILDNKRNPGHARGRRGRTAALLGGLVLALTLPDTGLRAQVLDISKSVLLSWPEPSQEQIVVGSGSLTGPVWTPWPEPIFNRFGQMCMAVPTTASQHYFKLTPGRQFADDFSSVAPTWMDWSKEPGLEWVITNGVLKVSMSPTPTGAFVLVPLGTNAAATLQDFYTSVDILDWVTSGNNWSVCALIGRGKLDNVGESTAYFGGVVLNHDGISGLVEPWIYVPERGYLDGATFYIHQIPPPYRLQFSMVGTNISFRVLRAATGQPIREMLWSGSELTNGVVGIWFSERNNAGDYSTNALDNFFLSGTK